MYNRFKAGLVAPSGIIKFLNDSYLVVWSYFFILCIIMTAPFLVVEASQQGLTSNQISFINENYSKVFNSNYEIINGELINNGDDSSSYLELDLYTIGFINNSSLFDANVIEIAFVKEGVRLQLLNTYSSLSKYDEIGLGNFDFGDYSKANKELFISSINKVLINNNLVNKTTQIVFMFLANGMEIMFLILIATFFNNSAISFKHRFKASIYASTVFVVLSFFSNIFYFSFLGFIGMIMMVFYVKKPFINIRPGIGDN